MAESARSLLRTVAIVSLVWLLYIAWLLNGGGGGLGRWAAEPPPVASPVGPDAAASALPLTRYVIHPVRGENFTLRDMKCTYHACFDIDACRLVSEYRIGVHIYPARRYLTPGGRQIFARHSRQFDQLLRAVRASPYYTDNPATACVFLPDIDTLNPHAYEIDWLPQYLYQLPAWWGSAPGVNHLLFESHPVRVALVRPGPTLLRLPIGRAMVASASFTERTYRSTFDVALPTLSTRRSDDGIVESVYDAAAQPLDSSERPHLLASAPPSAPGPLRRLRRLLGDDRLLLLDFCGGGGGQSQSAEAASEDEELRCTANGTRYAYPDVLSTATFCLVFYTQLTGSGALLDAVRQQCIPVILTNTNVFPFHELVEWNRFSIRLNREADLGSLLRMLTKFSRQYVAFMRYQMRLIYARYFASPAAIALAVLRVLNDRVFSHQALSMQEANGPPGGTSGRAPPLFHTAPISPERGYTAVVLTRSGRFYALARTLASLSRAASPPRHLRKVLVVWNSPDTDPPPPPPPPPDRWPELPPGVRLEIVRPRENRVTNRFLPYDAIETEAVLSLDDDVDVLLAGELLLAYNVWLENPDCIVGFPARLHSNKEPLYNAEWRGELSMVLTGAAFYHKQYGALFHDTLPEEVIDFIDANANCEDIAMNFLVANLTGKSPIKIGPRMKFRAENRAAGRLNVSDAGVEDGSGASGRLRSRCIAEFSRHFGGAAPPLQTVAFRADPVLYKTPYASWPANAQYADLDGVL